MKPLSIQLRGSKHHTDIVRQLLASFPNSLKEASCNAELLYSITAGVRALDSCAARCLLPLGTWRPVLHWIGSDTLYWRAMLHSAASASPRARASLALRRNILRSAVHLAGAPWLAREVEALGFSVEFVPVPALLPAWDPPALPKRPTFLVYLPEGREAFYGWQLVVEAAASFPAGRFLVLKHRPIAHAPANVEFLGNIEFSKMPSLFAASTALLRLPEHDGMSLMVLEALAFGRYVIWNYPFEGCIHCPREAEALRVSLETCARLTDINDSGRDAIDPWRPARVIETLANALHAAKLATVPESPWLHRLRQVGSELLGE
jgi:hypothetical protein